MIRFFWDYSDTVFPFLVLLLLILAPNKLPKGHFLLCFYLLFTTIVMGLSNYFADRSINNMYLYHVYSLAEVILVIPMIVSFSSKNDRLMGLSILGYSLFWLIDIIYIEPVSKFNSNSASVAALLIALFCFRHFLSVAKSDNILYFQRVPSFWIVSGFLFYCIAAVLVIGSYKYKDWFKDIDTHVTWKIQQVANIIKFVVISIGVLCCYRQTSQDGLL